MALICNGHITGDLRKNEHLQACRIIHKHEVAVKSPLWGLKSVIGHTFCIALL